LILPLGLALIHTQIIQTLNPDYLGTIFTSKFLNVSIGIPYIGQPSIRLRVYLNTIVIWVFKVIIVYNLRPFVVPVNEI